MGLRRILPLLFVIVASVAKPPPRCPQPQHYSDTSLRNCLCPAGSPTIVDSVDQDNAGVERLVIFFYRTVKTGKIIHFIPNKDLQRRIPDFPEEYGTVKDISRNPILNNMFKKHIPSKDTRYIHSNNHHLPNIHDKTEYPPWFIPVDIGFENNLPRIPVKPYSKDNIHDLPHVEVKPFSDHNKEHIYKVSPNDNIQPNENNPKKIELGHNHNPNDASREHVSGETREETDKPLFEHELDSDGSSKNPSPYPENKEKHEENPTQNENESHQTVDGTLGPFKPDYDTDRTLGLSIYPWKQEDLNQDAMNKILSLNVTPKEKLIFVPQKDDHGRIVGWTRQTSASYWESNRDSNGFINVHPFPHGGMIEPDNFLIHKYLNNKYENIPSFDNWLKKQLNITTLNGNRIPTSAQDINALHIEIRNVLLQNGLIVTKYGTLIDGHGKESSLDNLKLRPILIGKSISYNRFLKHVDSDTKFKIPSGTPFLEGLLLTMVKPAKILGIVPLAIRSLPDYGLAENNPLPNNEHGKSGQKVLMKILPIDHVVSFRKHSQAKKAKIASQQASRFGLIKRIRNRFRPENENRDNQNNAQFDSQELVAKKAEKESDYFARLREPVKPQKTSEEKPDYRIIGGISATMSGTPLLNRGRSGYQPLTHPL